MLPLENCTVTALNWINYYWSKIDLLDIQMGWIVYHINKKQHIHYVARIRKTFEFIRWSLQVFKVFHFLVSCHINFCHFYKPQLLLSFPISNFVTFAHLANFTISTTMLQHSIWQIKVYSYFFWHSLTICLSTYKKKILALGRCTVTQI